MKGIAARLAGLRSAMEKVMSGSTPDTGKWTGVNNFVRAYCDLAREYGNVTGDRSVRIFDETKLKNPFDMVWPAQKSLFDAVYAQTLMLESLAAQEEITPIGPLYNLLVSGSEDAWNGAPFQIEVSRCIREYTDPNLSSRYAQLDAVSVTELTRAPSIFAYEIGHKRKPKFGYIRDIVQRQGQVRLEYTLHEVEPFLSADDLEAMSFELDIGKFELYRTHWALKEVHLAKELHAKGIEIPASLRDVTNAVDISKHVFDVALSFPGESRALVEMVVRELERLLGPNKYFYDNNYVSQLAQPSLDTLLQGVYSRAKLDVVFIGADYQNKDWCGVEFRAVREIIFGRQNGRVMFVKLDDGAVEGIFKTDGYIDARKYSPAEIASFICERHDVLQKDDAAQSG